MHRQQRDFAARVGADAHKAQAQLQQAQQRGGQLAVESATLAQALEQEAALNKQASSEILHLEQQLQEATKQASEASKTLEKVSSTRFLYELWVAPTVPATDQVEVIWTQKCCCARSAVVLNTSANDCTGQCPCHMAYMTWPVQVGTESLNMRQAMKIMKEQAAAMAVQAQQQAQEAAAQKADAEASLTTANADLAEERTKFADLQVPHMRLLTERSLPAGVADRWPPMSCFPKNGCTRHRSTATLRSSRLGR